MDTPPQSDSPSMNKRKVTEFKISAGRKYRNLNLGSKFDKRLSVAAVRQASEGGYLVSPTRAFLLERCKTSNKPTRSLREIEYIHLSYFHIRNLGHIQSCRLLRVCILHNNYLTRFRALENCPHLIRLDLHSNQITKLPDEFFWKEMKSLKILNLHDNGLGKLESIQALAGCSSLIALTLYDTPLSLKHNYRHHTVNTIWSLKAIDRHVIGDDEIIEDASFSKRFTALNPCLMVDLCPKEIEPSQTRTLELEEEVVKKILTDINKILIHGSPVVVIQRWVRGHISRKKQNISYYEVMQKMRKLNPMMRTHTTPGGSQAGESLGLDYDTYLKNRRPGSKTPSSVLRREEPAKIPVQEPQFKEKEDEKASKSFPSALRINLAQLEQNALRSFDNSPDEGITIHVHHDTGLPVKSLFSKPLQVTFLQEQTRGSPTKPCAPVSTPATAPIKGRRRDPVTVQQMLGPTEALVRPAPVQHAHPVLGTLVERSRAEKREIGVQCEGADGEIPNHEWRVHARKFEMAGGKPAFAEIEPTQEHLLMNREAGRDVREAVEYWHDQEFSKPKPQLKKSTPPPRLRDNVSLATLMAVSKAYRDRDRSDLVGLKVDRVMRIQQERAQAKQIVSAYKEEKRTQALNQRQEDQMKLAEALQQHEITKNAYVEFAQERKERAIQRHRARYSELMFASDFGNQQTSVSNALIRHDRQAAKDDVKADKEEIVSGIKVQLTEQADLVRRYMEHMQITRQMRSAQEKSNLDGRVLQEANDRILAARQRVAGIKARKAAVQAYQHSLPVTANASSWPLNVSRNQPHGDAVEHSGYSQQQQQQHQAKVKTAPNAPVLRIHEADHSTLRAQGHQPGALELLPVPPFPSANQELAASASQYLPNTPSSLAMQG